jgi:hypothetical protein
MLSLKNLFKVRQIPLYSVRRSAVDDRKYKSNKYRDNIVKNSVSDYIFRNAAMNDFIISIQHVLADLIDAVNHLKNYKSFTTKKDDSNVK